MKDAIYDAAKAKERAKDNAVNPLVQDGKKLVPSVTRVFAQNRDIYVYLQAYKPSAGKRCGRLNGRTLRRRRCRIRSWHLSRCIRMAPRHSRHNRSR